MHMRYFGATLSKCTEYFLLSSAFVDHLTLEPAKFTRTLSSPFRVLSFLENIPGETVQ